MSESPSCVGCKKREGPLRECADGLLRCHVCRRAWIDKQHAIPAKTPPASVGEQSRFI
jgi:hypothetical protein